MLIKGGGYLDIYVVDTSALIRDMSLLDKIHDGEIIIHTTVLEELDNLKKKNNSTGMCARKIGDRLYELSKRGDLFQGIRVGTKRIRFDSSSPDPQYLRPGYSAKKKDNLSKKIARRLKDKTANRITLLTGDNFFLLKAAEDDIEVEFVKKPHSHKRKKSPHKGYFNNQLSVMRR